jgi:cytochrome c peroxidase
MRNEITQLSEQEKKGFNLFMGKGKCGICHFMPVFNGTAPPSFTHTDSEVIGVFESTKSKKLDKDLGRGKLNPFEDWLYAFKTPTLRNIGKTAPYMHNGAYKTLEDVIDFYNNGGAVGMGVDLPNQTLASDKLNLTATEKKSLISFLQTLSDE